LFAVQEFEERLVDDEDPEEVERELIGAQDYYEKEHEEKAEKAETKAEEAESKEPKEHEGHDHAEGEEHGEDEEDDTESKDPQDRLKMFMEWLFGKIEVLETENTRQ
jgi:hypothetical protein